MHNVSSKIHKLLHKMEIADIGVNFTIGQATSENDLLSKVDRITKVLRAGIDKITQLLQSIDELNKENTKWSVLMKELEAKLLGATNDAVQGQVTLE